MGAMAQVMVASAILAGNTWSEPGSTLNAARFGISVAGNATISSDGTTINLSGESVVSDAGILYIKNPIAKATATYMCKTKCTNGSPGGSWPAFLALQQGASPPVVNTNTAYLAGSRLGITGTVYNTGSADFIDITYRNTSGSWLYWNPAGSWNTTYSAAATGLSINNVECQFIFETTATQFRLTVKSADGLTTIAQTSWVNWSDTMDDGNSEYLWQGDPYTNYYITGMKTSLISKS